MKNRYASIEEVQEVIDSYKLNPDKNKVDSIQQLLSFSKNATDLQILTFFELIPSYERITFIEWIIGVAISGIFKISKPIHKLMVINKKHPLEDITSYSNTNVVYSRLYSYKYNLLKKSGIVKLLKLVDVTKVRIDKKNIMNKILDGPYKLFLKFLLDNNILNNLIMSSMINVKE